MKKILGLDLGTNSIGWALINQDFENKKGEILGMGSRIIPMGQDMLGDFEKGVTVSLTAKRTGYRTTRKLYQRDNLRRERLHRVLNILGFLPKHYQIQIDFEFHKGQFLNHGEPKISYFKNSSGKFEFLFKDSFNEMIVDFKKDHPKLFENGKKIPFDWTIYYLRKKALTQKISNQELAWVIMNFNQKRGYYQLSEQDENEDRSKIEEFHALKVVDIVDTGEKKKSGETWYHVILENGWVYPRASKISISEWQGKTKEFIVTTELNPDGTVKKNKDGEEKRSFRAPKEDDWGLLKKKTEFDINKSKKTVGTYIYESLLEDPTQKIRGKLIRTIERKFYRRELKDILQKQLEFHAELQNQNLYTLCIEELYPNNEAHRKNIENRGFIYLFMDDIIFYQRPLKTKTHLISDCSLEFRIRKDNKEKIGVKCITKSNPLFQEFRLWQFLSNLRIYEREREGNFDVDVTNEFLSSEDKWTELYDWLNDKEKINQKQLLAYFKLKEAAYRWNYVEDKDYPCNETRNAIISRLKKLSVDVAFLNQESTQLLWHLLYSVTDPDQRKTAIKKIAKKYSLNEEFEEVFSKFPLFKRDYGAFSEKAIKKLLPLMRRGKYWSESSIDQIAKERVNGIVERLNSINNDIEKLEEISDDDIPKQVLRSFIRSGYSTKGLNTFQASYLIYGRHSEAADTRKWKTPQDIADYLNPKLKDSFKQHSLRNPIVEQVLTETLRIVKDIWEEFGNSEEDFFSEIHVELGREMKNDKKTRERISKQVTENENTNLRIRSILNELLGDGIDVRPYSPSQQEILKIYEEGIYQSESRKELKEEIDKIRKSPNPSKSEVLKYKLWLEQGYISPYTGNTILLSDLFTHKYQIEHIYPQSRYFDDSLSNKIICESEVNQLKDNKTAYEFISEFGGQIVNKSITIFTKEAYENHIRKYFSQNKIKRENLLSQEIPDSFINRQMNDSRYISKIVKNLLSKIVREDNEQEMTSKHIVTMPGAITSQMKNDWGLNDVWNDIITPRFIRMNELTKSNDFGDINPNTKKFLPKVPDSIAKGFNKKRIDHRHHALDALVIACTTRTHINFLNNLNAKDENDKTVKHELRNKLCFKSKTDDKGNYKWLYHKPWETFTQDSRKYLETIVVSFKQNNRVINKTKNKYQKWVKDENGVLKKKRVPQVKGENWAIRKAMHKDTVYGAVLLHRDKKIVNAHAGRVELSENFTIKHVQSITDTGIQKILTNHLKYYVDANGKEQPDLAFNQDGIDELNKNIIKLNDGKAHQPIKKVRIYEVGNKFMVGTNGHKSFKYVEAAKGTNLFFAIYSGKNKKGDQIRQYSTIPLNEAIESLKQGGSPAPEKYYDKDKCEYNLLFTLSPNDLVYVPTEEEMENPNVVNFSNLTKNQIERVYKMEKASGIECYFTRNDIASLIKQYDAKTKFGELSSQNKLETTMELANNSRIKEKCWKITMNRLGKIISAIK